MRCYELVIRIQDFSQACHLWSLVRQNIHARTFESFADFNYAVLAAIYKHKQTYQVSGTKRPRFIMCAPALNVKRQRV
jgi:hypothetical protein